MSPGCLRKQECNLCWTIWGIFCRSRFKLQQVSQWWNFQNNSAKLIQRNKKKILKFFVAKLWENSTTRYLLCTATNSRGAVFSCPPGTRWTWMSSPSSSTPSLSSPPSPSSPQWWRLMLPNHYCHHTHHLRHWSKDDHNNNLFRRHTVV